MQVNWFLVNWNDMKNYLNCILKYTVHEMFQEYIQTHTLLVEFTLCNIILTYNMLSLCRDMVVQSLVLCHPAKAQ